MAGTKRERFALKSFQQTEITLWKSKALLYQLNHILHLSGGPDTATDSPVHRQCNPVSQTFPPQVAGSVIRLLFGFFDLTGRFYGDMPFWGKKKSFLGLIFKSPGIKLNVRNRKNVQSRKRIPRRTKQPQKLFSGNLNN